MLHVFFQCCCMLGTVLEVSEVRAELGLLVSSAIPLRRRWAVLAAGGQGSFRRALSSFSPCLLPFAGVLKFARLIKSYESQDPEIASMSGKLKALFLPPMTLPPHGAGIGGVAAS